MQKIRLIFTTVLILLICAVFILPLYWALVASLGEVGTAPPASIVWWPERAAWDNYTAVFNLIPLARYIGNSLLVVLTAVPLTLLTASLAGFAMAQMPATMQRTLLIISIAWMVIPATAVWMFRFHLFRWFGLLDSYWALILPAFAAGSPLFVLLYYWTFRQIPYELFEAGRLDGLSAWVAWHQLAMPLARPATLAVGVLAFVLFWGDFVSPVLYINDPAKYTLPVGLQILNQVAPTNWPYLMTAAVIMTLPIIVVFLLMQRAFLRDINLANLYGRQ